jgi:hypothetical protein
MFCLLISTSIGKGHISDNCYFPIVVLRLDLGRFFSFLIYTQSVGILAWGISPSQGRYLTQTQHKRTQTSMPRVGFEPTTPVFERAKIVHALDRAADKWDC